MPPKRKNDAPPAQGPSKRVSLDAPHVAVAQHLITSILETPAAFDVPQDQEAVRDNFVSLAEYAQSLEQQLAAHADDAPTAVLVQKTQAELEEAAEKIKKVAASGISKQMGWKPSCTQGSAKFAYDGLCPDPAVFGALLGLGGPPQWSMKKFPLEEFEKYLGTITSEVRYATLYITSPDVTIRWSDTGEFKISGCYGKYGTSPPARRRRGIQFPLDRPAS